MHGSRLRFPLLVLVAGALVVAVWMLLGGSEHKEATHRVVAEVPQRPSPSFADAPASAPASPDAVVQSLLPEAAAVDSELRLIVVREGDEGPLVGVSTDVTTAGGIQRALTDATGRVRLTVPSGPIEVEIAATASTRFVRARFEAAGDQRVVVLHRGGEVTGRVVGLDGGPVQGALVVLWSASPDDAVDWNHPDRTTVTDAGGAFTLQDTAGAEGDPEWFLLAARKSDCASLFALASRTSQLEDVHGARLVLGDAPPISVRVRSSTGESVPALVLAQADCGAYLAWCATQSAPLPEGAWLQRDAGCTVQPLRIQLVIGTGAGAAYRPILPGLADRWTLRVLADDLPNGYVERDAAVDRSPIEIVLPAPVSLYGSVRDASGAAVRDARITLYTLEGHGSVDADESGAWRFDDEAPGAARLTASSPGYANWVEEFDLSDPQAGPHVIVLQPGLPLSGSVLDPQGKPLLAVLVQLTNETTATASSPFARGFGVVWDTDREIAATGNGGAFRFDDLAPGRYRVLLVDRPHAGVLAVALANAGDTHVRLVQGEGLDLIAHTTGRVLDAAGQPRADVLIHVQAYADAGAQRLTLETDTYPDETAHFTLPDMAPCWVRLTVWRLPDMRMPAAAWERTRGEPLLTWGPQQVAGGTQELELHLPR